MYHQIDYETMNRGELLERVKDSPSILGGLSEEMRNDKEIIKVALEKEGERLLQLSETLRNDFDLVLLAVKHPSDSYCSGTPLEFASEELRGNRRIVREAIKHDPQALKYSSDELRNDREIIKETMYNDFYSFKLDNAGEIIKDDREMCLKAVKLNGENYEFVSKRLRKDREIALCAVRSCLYSRNFDLLDPELKNDKSFIMEAVEKNGGLLERISEEFKNDRDIARKAINETNYIFRYIGEKLKTDVEFVLEILKSFPKTVKEILTTCPLFRNEKKIVMECVKISGATIVNASEELKRDREVILKAVKQNGIALFCIGDENVKLLEDDREIILSACESYGYALQLASERLRNDREIVMKAISLEGKNSRCFDVLEKFGGSEILKDREVILYDLYQEFVYNQERLKKDKRYTSVSKKEKSISHFVGDRDFLIQAMDYGVRVYHLLRSVELRRDEEIILKSMKICGSDIQYVPENLKLTRRDVVLEAVDHGYVKTCEEAIKFVESNEIFRNDKEIVLKVMKLSPRSLYDMSDEMKNDEDVYFESLKHGGCVRYGNERFVSDRESVLKIVKTDGEFLKDLPSKWKNDEEIVREAVNNDGNALLCLCDRDDIREEDYQFFPHKLLKDEDFWLSGIRTRHKLFKILLHNNFLGWQDDDDEEEESRMKEFMIKAVELNPKCFKYVPYKLHDVEEIVLPVIKNELRKNKKRNELMKKDNISRIEFLINEVQSLNREEVSSTLKEFCVKLKNISFLTCKFFLL